MKQTLRTSDLLVRWGGEEFLIMAKDDNFEGARLLSLRLLKAIESELFDLDGIEINITISIGYCGFPILSESPNQFGWKNIVEMADSALYKAKDGGRKQSVGVQFKNEILTDKNCELLKQDFDKALEKGIIEIITSTTDL
jgi:diguanylate cyclase (GGDEF)-like protein